MAIITLNNNSLSSVTALPAGVGGKVLQIVNGTDGTTYGISISAADADYAGSTAFSITPTSASSKIMIHFFVGQACNATGSGFRIRLYRQINSTGGFTLVTGLSGTGVGSRFGALTGNSGNVADGYEDGNRTRNHGGTVVDTPNTINLVEYKLYYGQGDGTGSIYVNRTENDTDANYTHRSLTHVTLLEIGT